MKKSIELELKDAREMYGKNPVMDKLLLANFTEEELTKKGLPKSWKELEQLIGFYVDNNSEISSALNNYSVVIANRNCFATEKQAKSSLAMAQLSQLMAVYNDGWKPDWENSSLKYIIDANQNSLFLDTHYRTHAFLSFKAKELRDEFLKNFEPLIKEYFMID